MSEKQVIQPEVTMQLEVDAREFDTIVAGLRLWQATLEVDSEMISTGELLNRYSAIRSYGIPDEHGEPLTPEEIDKLVMRLNGGE